MSRRRPRVAAPWAALFLAACCSLFAAAAAAPAPACAAAFTGPGCASTVEALPACIRGAFKGSWLTLYKGAVKESASAPGADDAWVVDVDIPAASFAGLPERDAFGLSAGAGTWRAGAYTRPLFSSS